MAREARTDRTGVDRTIKRNLIIAESAMETNAVITFTYRKQDGSTSSRTGTVDEIQQTGRGPRVWLVSGDTRKQFDPAYMTRATLSAR